MVDNAAHDRRERRRGRTGEAGSESSRRPDYRSLKNPFLPQPVFSEDQVAAIHDTALRVLEELGIKVLLPQAREVFASAGALVDPDTDMVRIGRDMVVAALASAPKSIHAQAGDRSRDLTLELGSMTFLAGCGAPNVRYRSRHGTSAAVVTPYRDAPGHPARSSVGSTADPTRCPPSRPRRRAAPGSCGGRRPRSTSPSRSPAR